MSRLILASASPQRKTLLEGLDLTFEVMPSAIEESSCPEKDPLQRAKALAHLKARDVAVRNPGCIVIGCDTLVVSADGTLLEKPMDEKDALGMLRLQSGRTSLVHSGLTVIGADGKEFSGISTSSVTFKKLSHAEEQWWIASGAWKDRSGAFQIEGQGQFMIERIDGDWTGVVGLPVFLLGELLDKAGVSVVEVIDPQSCTVEVSFGRRKNPGRRFPPNTRMSSNDCGQPDARARAR